MAKNKIIFGGEVLIDLTADTVDTSTLLNGATAHDKSGAIITGECTYDADTSDANVAVAEILKDRTAYARGAKLTGIMPNNGAVAGTISTKAGSYTVPQGYHDGSGKVNISATEQAKLIGGNIKSGVTILGVPGTYSGSAVTSQTKEATPTKTGLTVQPDAGYDYLSAVTVKPIPYVESTNAFGTTVIIG